MGLQSLPRCVLNAEIPSLLPVPKPAERSSEISQYWLLVLRLSELAFEWKDSRVHRIGSNLLGEVLA